MSISTQQWPTTVFLLKESGKSSSFCIHSSGPLHCLKAVEFWPDFKQRRIQMVNSENRVEISYLSSGKWDKLDKSSMVFPQTCWKNKTRLNTDKKWIVKSKPDCVWFKTWTEKVLIRLYLVQKVNSEVLTRLCLLQNMNREGSNKIVLGL